MHNKSQWEILLEQYWLTYLLTSYLIVRHHTSSVQVNHDYRCIFFSWYKMRWEQHKQFWSQNNLIKVDITSVGNRNALGWQWFMCSLVCVRSSVSTQIFQAKVDLHAVFRKVKKYILNYDISWFHFLLDFGSPHYQEKHLLQSLWFYTLIYQITNRSQCGNLLYDLGINAKQTRIHFCYVCVMVKRKESPSRMFLLYAVDYCSCVGYFLWFYFFIIIIIKLNIFSCL